MAKRRARLLDDGMQSIAFQDLDHFLKSAAPVVHFDYGLANHWPVVSANPVENVYFGSFGVDLQIIKAFDILFVNHIRNRAKLTLDVDLAR